MKAVWLTTVDNPFNPFTRFDEWLNFDSLKGYKTMNYLSRVAVWNDQMSKEAKDQAFEDAVDEIMKLNPYAKEIYKKVDEDSEFEIN